MIHLYHMTDYYEIKISLLKDNLFHNILELDSLDNWVPNLTNTAFYAIYLNHQHWGTIILQPFSTNSVMFHGGVYKTQRSANTPQILHEILILLRQHNNFQWLTTVLSSNKSANKLIQNLGFKYKTTIPNGSLKGDLIIYGEQ